MKCNPSIENECFAGGNVILTAEEDVAGMKVFPIFACGHCSGANRCFDSVQGGKKLPDNIPVGCRHDRNRSVAGSQKAIILPPDIADMYIMRNGANGERIFPLVTRSLGLQAIIQGIANKLPFKMARSIKKQTANEARLQEIINRALIHPQAQAPAAFEDVPIPPPNNIVVNNNQFLEDLWNEPLREER